MKKTDMNLLDSYKRVTKIKANKDATNRIYIAIVIGAILIAGALWGKLLIDNSFIKQDIKAVEQYVNDPQIQARAAEAEELNAEIEDIETILSELENANEAFDYMPRLDSNLIYLILDQRPGTVRVNNISFTGDSIVLDISGTRIYSVSDYVLRLRRLSYFQEIQYSGYSFDGRVYNSSINLILEGGR